VWCLYFDRTDYQVELPAFMLGFLMKICAPFVLATAVGLARAVPQRYADRIAREEHFYGPLGRRCRQRARQLAASAAGAAGLAPRRRALGLQRASLAKPPPKVAGARPAVRPKAHSFLDLRQMGREQGTLSSRRSSGASRPVPTAPLDHHATAASPSPSSSGGNCSSNPSSGGSEEGPGIRGRAVAAPPFRRSHESCLF
jgi:hypothetical protein